MIDTCLVNQVRYDRVARTKLQQVAPCPKSNSKPKQRGARAGRHVPGMCLQLVTAEEWENLPERDPIQPQMEDLTAIYLELSTTSCTAIKESMLTQLGRTSNLREIVIEKLWTHEMVDMYGELAQKRFAATLDCEPELTFLSWYGKEISVMSEAPTIFTSIPRVNKLFEADPLHRRPRSTDSNFLIVHTTGIRLQRVWQATTPMKESS